MPDGKRPRSPVRTRDRSRFLNFSGATKPTHQTKSQTAAKLLRNSFVVHPERSLDKSEELGDSQVGYRSIHLICEMGKDRVTLPAYKPYKGLLFEIQIRTALQHAWAEIDHNRG